MTTRRYAQKSIFDLEAIFERSRNNASELEVLLNELTFRNTAKARMLTTKIEQARTALNGRCVVSMSGSSPSARHPGSASTQSSQVSSRDAPATVVQKRPKANPAPIVQQ
ncbi:hypothetical protein, partial [Serratia ureilytica]|uniref:hypothetical protein n=1 Tax=Serratia ureilytica TaxID=300181 RepID=UPI00235E6525